MKEWLDKLFKAPTESTFIQLFRYGFVGGLAFLVDYGTMVLLTEFAGMHYLLAATISFILGLITNYLLSITWVFNQHKLNNRWVEFLLSAWGSTTLSCSYAPSDVASTIRFPKSSPRQSCFFGISLQGNSSFSNKGKGYEKGHYYRRRACRLNRGL